MDIDNLSISISASATKASNAIDKIVGRLGALENALAQADFSKLNAFAQGADAMARAMSSLSGITMPDYNRLAKGIERISNIDTSKVTATAKSLQNIGNALSTLNDAGMANAIENMTNFSESIRKLGFKSVEQAITNMPRLATSVKQLMETLSTAPQVSKNLVDMINALAKLSEQGSKIGAVSNSLGKKFSSLGNIFNSTKKHSTGLAGAFGKLYASYWVLFRAFGKLKEGIDLSSSLTETENVVRTVFGEYEGLVNKMAQTSIQDYGMSELSVKKIASRFQAMGTAMGFSQGKMAEMSVQLTKLTGDMASFYDESQEDVARRLQSIFSGETEPMRRYGIDLTNATLKQYALSKGITTSITSMTQAQKAALRYQYTMENLSMVNGDFQRTSDSWHNQVTMLSQSFQQFERIVGGSLINAFKPFINVLNDVMVKVNVFAETVTNALGSIFGWKYESSASGIADDWSSAAGSAEDLADATGTAANNAKKLNKSIRAFDELNVISLESKNKSSGSGSGASAGTGATSGGLVQTDSILKGYESSVENLYQLGTIIENALSKAMEGIDWNKAYEKAKDFGSGLAHFLNGTISPRLFGDVGTTIANSLNTATQAAFNFAKDFDFYNFGKSIANGINKFFENFDFGTLSSSINKWVDGLEKTIKGFIDNIDLDTIFRGIKDFFSNLDFDSFIVLSAASLPSVIPGFEKLHKSIKPVLDLMEGSGGIIGKFGGFLGGLSTPAIIVAGALATLAGGLAYTFKENENVRKSFEEAVDAITKNFKPAIEFVTDTVIPDLKNGFEIMQNVMKPFTDFLNDTFVSIWQDIINPVLQYVGDELLPEVQDAFETLWNNALVPLGNFIATVFEPIVKILSDALKVLWQKVVVPLAKAIGGVFSETLKAIIEVFKDVSKKVGVVSDVLKFLWEKAMNPLINFLVKRFGPTFEAVFDMIEGLIDGLGQAFSGLVEFMGGMLTGDMQKVLDGIVNIIKGAFNSIVSIIEGVLNAVINELNSFFQGFDGVVSGFGKVIGIDISIPTIPKVNIPRLETGGYLPKQYSLFMAGENGIPEIAGTVGGKTAVAGGAEITGIRDAIYSTSQQEIEMLRQQNQLLQGILEKEFGITQDEIGRSARKYGQEQYRRTGNNVYVY